MYVHVREWNARRRRTGTVRTETQTASEFVRGKVASSFDATRSLVTAFYDSLWCGNYHDSQQRSRGGGKERGESLGESRAEVPRRHAGRGMGVRPTNHAASAVSNRDAITNEWKRWKQLT